MESQWKWKEILLGGTGVAVIGGVFTLGLMFGEKTLRQELAEASAKSERELAAKEADLRQCSNTNASLQAVLQLSEKDRNRLLEATAIEPPIRLSYEGRPFSGKVLLSAQDVSGSCIHPAIWLENTGVRDVVPTGVEILMPEPYGGRAISITSVVAIRENGKRVNRYWVDFNLTLPPGSRRFLETDICKGSEGSLSEVPIPPGEEVPATLVLFASGYLPLRVPVVFVTPPASP